LKNIINKNVIKMHLMYIICKRFSTGKGQSGIVFLFRQSNIIVNGPAIDPYKRINRIE